MGSNLRNQKEGDKWIVDSVTGLITGVQTAGKAHPIGNVSSSVDPVTGGISISASGHRLSGGDELPATRNFMTTPWTLFSDFSEAWGVATGATSMADLYQRYGSQSRLWTPAGNSQLTLTGLNGCLATMGSIGLWVFLDTYGSQATQNQTPTINVYFGEGNLVNTMQWNWTSGNLRQGWNFLVTDVYEDGNTWGNPQKWTANGTADFSHTFDRIQLNCNSTNTNLYLGGLVYGGKAKAKVTFGFDNCAVTNSGGSQARSVYEHCFPLMQQYGIKGYLAIPGRAVSVNFSPSRNQEMYAAGWDIINHTANHMSGQSLTDDQIVSEYLNQRDWLLSYGFETARYFGAYPVNSSDRHLCDVLGNLGQKCWRGQTGKLQFVDSNFSFPENPMLVPSVDVSSLTLAQAQNLVNVAIRMGASIHFFTHGLDVSAGGNYWSTANFDAFIPWLAQQVAAGLIDSETPTSWYSKLNNSKLIRA